VTIPLRALRAFWKDQTGVSVTEYGLMIAGVVLLLLVVIQPTADGIKKFFEQGFCTILQDCG
jgi:Flp pilus assembly pilin Flp